MAALFGSGEAGGVFDDGDEMPSSPAQPAPESPVSSGLLGELETGGQFRVETHALSVEPATENGELKRVHVVAKNNPFLIDVHVADPVSPSEEGGVTFAGEGAWAVTGALYFEGGAVPVVENFDTIRTKAFASDTPGHAKLECRLFVLSSHHRDSLFTIRLTATRPGAQPVLVGETDPLRVVSKPSQVRNAEAKRRRNDPTDLSKKQRAVRAPQLAAALAQQGNQLGRIEQRLADISAAIGPGAPSAPFSGALVEAETVDVESRFAALLSQCVAAFAAVPVERRSAILSQSLRASDLGPPFAQAVVAQTFWASDVALSAAAEESDGDGGDPRPRKKPRPDASSSSSAADVDPFAGDLGLASLGRSWGLTDLSRTSDLLQLFSQEGDDTV
jgi:hypothetical protein